MQLLFLFLTVMVLLAQGTRVTKCWNTRGRCRMTCKEKEVFYILCKYEGKCCVEPKYVHFKPKAPNAYLETLS
ncbi:beta-defensin 121 [Sciurus carolinensis]|uniref:beta-defensin 121 n=1 Tax=Sciurus carolinensis TaxID=30640 RepID=UPI001FB384D1|nr:beta-defensin 121 [Sciurus carolinensis]